MDLADDKFKKLKKTICGYFKRQAESELIIKEFEFIRASYGDLTQQSVTSIDIARRQFGVPSKYWLNWYKHYCKVAGPIKIIRVFSFEKEKPGQLILDLNPIIERAQESYIEFAREQIESSKRTKAILFENYTLKLAVDPKSKFASHEGQQQIENAVKDVGNELNLETIEMALLNCKTGTQLKTNSLNKLNLCKKAYRISQLWERLRRHVFTDFKWMVRGRRDELTAMRRLYIEKIKKMKLPLSTERFYIKRILPCQLKSRCKAVMNSMKKGVERKSEYLSELQNNKDIVNNIVKNKMRIERIERKCTTSKFVEETLSNYLRNIVGTKNVSLILSLCKGDLDEFNKILIEDKEIQTHYQSDWTCQILQAYKFLILDRDFKRAIVDKARKATHIKTPINFIRGIVGSQEMTTYQYDGIGKHKLIMDRLTDEQKELAKLLDTHKHWD
jgi:hypothetical protein